MAAIRVLPPALLARQILALALVCGAGPAGVAAEPRPNIVLIMADDLGFGEIGAYGVPGAPTPRIDALARSGVRLTDGYVTAPQCAPTRAGLMTGRYQQRFGFYNNPPAPSHPTYQRFGLPASEGTLAEALKRQGYATGLVGKWHLGFKPEQHPMSRGFDEFFGFLSGGHGYFGNEPGNPILRNRKVVTESAYLTRAFTREAITFIERNANRPFFLYAAYNSVHLPLQAERHMLARFTAVKDPRRRQFLAMLGALDEGVGAIVDTLRARGLLRRTLVVVTSDNGCVTAKSTCRNTPLRGGKGMLHEGGVRVPFVLSWPGVLPAGKTFRRTVSTLDLFPTFLSAASGGRYRNPRLDGVDLLPFLTGKLVRDPHRYLFWGSRNQGTVRAENYKLSIGGDGTRLYDLRADIGETTDLAARRPQVRDRLARARRVGAAAPGPALAAGTLTRPVRSAAGRSAPAGRRGGPAPRGRSTLRALRRRSGSAARPPAAAPGPRPARRSPSGGRRRPSVAGC